MNLFLRYALLGIILAQTVAALLSQHSLSKYRAAMQYATETLELQTKALNAQSKALKDQSRLIERLREQCGKAAPAPDGESRTYLIRKLPVIKNHRMPVKY
jgi:hypothetical protein